ncbi:MULTISPECIES: hypothetical protein [unclassified Enterococcus]|uniref:hypothetical protein n=1 Tax=unclassified Enterococcus TaxID=2608891 RepID=UPI0013E9E6BC|nr:MULTISPECIES: hypothetical protein [unclassified Enterococcus]
MKKIGRIVIILFLGVFISNQFFICINDFRKDSLVYAEENRSTSLNWNFFAGGHSRITTIKFEGNKVIGTSNSGGYSEYYCQLKVTVTGADGKIRWTRNLTNQSTFEMGELQENDTITISPIVMNGITSYDITGQPIICLSTDDLNLNNNKSLSLKFKNGFVTRVEGTGTAQVTYNVNTMTPDDPTSNPEYTVLIPLKYELTDAQKVAAGKIELKDAKDISKNYVGEKSVKVTVTSANGFKFNNGGEYKLIDGTKNDIPAEITLDKITSSSVVNAFLTKEGQKTAAADMLTFNYRL